MKKVIIVVSILLVIVLVGCYFVINSNTKKSNIDASNTLENANNQNANVLVNEIEQNKNGREEKMPTLNIKIGNKNFTATLEDNNTTRELVKQMPLTINMSELHGNEKYYYFNQSFPTDSERISRIENGDLMLYGSDCLVLFYESFSNSYSYTRLGKIDNPSGLANAVGKGNVQVTFSINN